MQYLQLIAQFFPATVTWRIVSLMVLMAALTLGGVTGRMMLWIESISTRSQLH